jgi:tRNA G18 (ribose-2'-O)-methylase SpoU
MRNWDFTKRKFLSLKEAHQHKMASELLKEIFSDGKNALLQHYKDVESWLDLPSIDLKSHEEISHRFHFHLEKAGLCQKEHFLLHIKKEDTPSDIPFLDVQIFLSSLRSAFNVGSIFRTVEAFRLGSIYCSSKTPTPENPKVQKASMGTYDKVTWHKESKLSELPRPWIALETASPSTPLSSYTFPESFTLILGNEEFGVPKEILLQCDAIIEIPLYGSKNSLNVASAFAITAANIRAQRLNAGQG